jgi:hypothetical protein
MQSQKSSFCEFFTAQTLFGESLKLFSEKTGYLLHNIPSITSGHAQTLEMKLQGSSEINSLVPMRVNAQSIMINSQIALSTMLLHTKIKICLWKNEKQNEPFS